MTRAVLALLIGALALVATAAGAAGRPLELMLTPASPNALDPTRIEISSASVAGLRVQVVSPEGRSRFVHLEKVSTHVAKAVFRYATAGRWHVRVVEHDGRIVRRRAVTVRQPVATPAPTGFGPLGRAGCTPASPWKTSPQGFQEIFGTAFGGEQLWAFGGISPYGTAATGGPVIADGKVGTELKVIFRMTRFHAPLQAISPDGTVIPPVWGPSFHSSSNWDRPGIEWGAGFVFPEPGCWQIRVGSYGSLDFVLRS